MQTISSLEAEAKVYTMLTRFQRAGALPNVAPLLAVSTCPAGVFIRSIPQEQLQQLTQFYSYIVKFTDWLIRNGAIKSQVPPPLQVLDARPIRCVTTQRIQGPTLREWLNEDVIEFPKPTDDAVLAVLLQMIYALGIMNATGVRHGDLHLDNIRLQQMSEDRIAYRPDPAGVYASSDIKKWWRFTTAVNNRDRDIISRIAQRSGTTEEDLLLQPMGDDKVLKFESDGERETWEYVRFEREHPLTDWFVLQKPVVPMIYDFDFGGKYDSVLTNIPNDLAIERCSSFSTCTSIKADMYTLFSIVADNLTKSRTIQARYPKTLGLLNRIVDPKLLMGGAEFSPALGGHNFRLCDGPFRLHTSRCELELTRQKCKPESRGWEPPDCILRRPWTALRDTVFTRWRQREAPVQDIDAPDASVSVWGGWGIQKSAAVCASLRKL